MRRQSSPANRYFLARLKTIGRPIFWGPAIVLLLLGLFTWDFWTSPNLWASLGIGESRTDDELPPEEKAIGADIDTLPVLFSDIKGSPKPEASPNVKQSPQAKKQITGGEAITTISTTGTGSPETTQPNPQGVYGLLGNALAERYGLTKSGLSGSETTSGGITSGIGIKSPAAVTPTQSPLQSAMSKFTAPVGTVNSGVSVNGLASPSSSAVDRPKEGSAPLSGSTGNASSGSENSFTNLVGGSQPLQNYSTLRAAPLVPAASSELPNLSPAPLPAGFGQTAVPQPTNTPETIPTQPPFSAPRPIPGRTIGGGNINTFSNP